MTRAVAKGSKSRGASHELTSGGCGRHPVSAAADATPVAIVHERDKKEEGPGNRALFTSLCLTVGLEPAQPVVEVVVVGLGGGGARQGGPAAPEQDGELHGEDEQGQADPD